MFSTRIKKVFEHKRVPNSRFKKIVNHTIEKNIVLVNDISEDDENNEPTDTINEEAIDDVYEDELFGNNSLDSEWTDVIIDSELRKSTN